MYFYCNTSELPRKQENLLLTCKHDVSAFVLGGSELFSIYYTIVTIAFQVLLNIW